MFKFIFVDLDDTIFDFQASEKASFYQLGKDLGLNVTPEIFQDYHDYNASLWAKIEEGQLTKTQLLEQRFPNYFAKYDINVENGKAIDNQFRQYLATTTQKKPGALDFLLAMKQAKKNIYAASNGVFHTQMSRLEQTNTKALFDNIFISENIGFEKPHPNFFYKAFEMIDDFHISQAIMVGDRIPSDMKGAHAVGMATAWFNDNAQKNTLNIPITIESDRLDIIKEYILVQ